MIKTIPPNPKDTTQNPEEVKSDTNTVSQETAEQFSSLLNETKLSQSKKLFGPKNNIKKSIDKIEDKLAKQVGSTKIERHSSDAKHSRSDDTSSSDLKTLHDKPDTAPPIERKDRQPRQTKAVFSSSRQTKAQSEQPSRTQSALSPSINANAQAKPSAQQQNTQTGRAQPNPTPPINTNDKSNPPVQQQNTQTSRVQPNPIPPINTNAQAKPSDQRQNTQTSRVQPNPAPPINANAQAKPSAQRQNTQASRAQPNPIPPINTNAQAKPSAQQQNTQTGRAQPNPIPPINTNDKGNPPDQRQNIQTGRVQPNPASPINTDDKGNPPVQRQNTTNKKETADNEDLPPQLDAIDIAAIIAGNPPPLRGATATTKVAPTAPADLNKIVGEIADRILVSSPADNPGGVQEIRVLLKESALPNTEVRIYRHAGSLQVEFVTTSESSHSFIAQRQSDIQKVLGERLSGETVTVSVQDGQQTRGGQGQGRSRQQYIAPDQEKDDQ